MFTVALLKMFVVPILAMAIGWAVNQAADRKTIDLGRSTRTSTTVRRRPTLRFDAFDRDPIGREPAWRIARRA